MKITRRQFFKGAAVIGAAGLVPMYFISKAFGGYTAKDFISPLAMPPQDFGKIIKGKRTFELNLQHGSTSFFEGQKTPTMGINTNFLGPVLRLNRGDDAVFIINNNLRENSTIHWHGLHIPAVMDGGPHQEIASGKTWQPEFNIQQPASTQWFHSHVHHGTGRQVYQGLAGLFYIDDDNSKKLDIPKEYGVNDIPLIIQDRNFNPDGSFKYVSGMHERMAGVQGEHILVNGIVRPQYKVTQKQIRFRILNGSNARSYNLQFSDKRRFTQIASDGGFLEKPVSLNQLRLTPGERAEIIVEFGNNEDVLLTHVPLPNKNPGVNMMTMMFARDTAFNVMRFISSQPEGEMKNIKGKLASLPEWKESDAAKIRRFKFSMSMGMMGGGSGGNFTINDRSFDLNRIDLRIRLNDIEIWELTNDSPMPHPVHIHDIQFRILSRNGKPPALNEQGLKDTVVVDPDETVRLITKFETFADENAPYMYHCHILEHEDNGMMGQFVVV